MGIGEKIKARRIELGWSQQKLADMMGYTSKSTITKIEKGISDVGQKHIMQFADVLGVSIAYLMGWEENDSNNSEAIKKDKLSGLDRNFYDYYIKLDPDSKSLVDSLVVLLQEEQPDSDRVLEMIGRLSAILHS